MSKKFNITDVVRANVAAMQPYSSARDEFTDFDKEMVFLDANENPFDNGVNRYPDPQQRALKSLLASQKKVSESQILVGNGSDEILDLLFRAFCNPSKDNIISLPPTYGMYKVLCGTNDIENREVLLDKDFQPNVIEIFKKVDAHTKMIFFCSPNNPSGNNIKKEAIAEVLENFSGLVVVDEAYIDFSTEDSWIKNLSHYPNLVVSQTLSKAYGMAGIRLGLCYANSEVITILNKIKPPYNVNALSQAKAYERLRDEKAVQEEISKILNSRKELAQVLDKISFVKEVFPSEANFILARVDDAGKRYQQLIAMGIVIRNRSTQPSCENTLRFTVGTPAENRVLVNALQKIE